MNTEIIGKDNYFVNSNNKKIFCKYWNESEADKKSIKYLVFIVHGLSEHCQRYNEIAEKVKVELSAFVFSHDHVGHGLSEGDRVMVNSLLEYTEDVIQHVRMIKQRYPNVPLILIAHSMGGTIAVQSILHYPDEIDALVNISPALHINPMDIPTWKVTLIRCVSTVLPWMPIAKSSDPTRHARRNKAKDKDYNEDVNVHHGYLKARWAIAFLDGLSSIVDRFSEINIPVLTLHGDDDDISLFQGSERLHREIKSEVQELKIYPGAYHELHTEPDGVGEACIEYFIEWIKKLNLQK